MTGEQREQIAILDFGSQYTQLIARRVRESGVYCEIFPFDIESSALEAFYPAGIILSGGPESVTQNSAPKIGKAVFELDVPVLGICYGMQAMAEQLGGSVSSSDKREFGHASIRLEGESIFLSALGSAETDQDVWMSHGDKVTQ